VDVFDLDQKLVDDYTRFARSFTRIRASDIKDQVDQIYATQLFWPEPLISLNPHFERDRTVDELVAEGSLHPNTGKVFCIDDRSIRLYRHQAESVAKASENSPPGIHTIPSGALVGGGVVFGACRRKS
jgi:hypothetical protein